MRMLSFAACIALTALTGCSGAPSLRSDPVEVKATVTLSGASPKDLSITLQPMQNSLPGGGKVKADGTFATQIVPGDYIVVVSEEANGKVPAFAKVPTKYRTPSEQNKVSVESGKELVIDLK
jgi:hypothetical protein